MSDPVVLPQLGRAASLILMELLEPIAYSEGRLCINACSLPGVRRLREGAWAENCLKLNTII